MSAAGYKHSAEAKVRIITALTGRPCSAETRAKISAANKGRKLSAEHRAKIGAAKRGRAVSVEQRAKISAALKGHKGNVGYIPTPETRAKLSAMRKGKPKSAAWRAKIGAANRGKIRSAETRAKISASLKGKFAGPKHPLWLGGLSRAPYAWEWNEELREEVRRRDGYKCQLCGMTQDENGRALTCHHQDYCKVNCDPVNLVTLCHACHSRTNINREYWEAFFLNRALARARQGLLF